MGKGRPWARALKSKVTPTGRWSPPPNKLARCVGGKLIGQKGGGKAGVRTRFIAAAKDCKAGR